MKTVSLLLVATALSTVPGVGAAQDPPARNAGQSQERPGQQTRTVRPADQAPPPPPTYTTSADPPPRLPGVTPQPATPIKVKTVKLDNAGVADWDYVNARNPPFVWDRVGLFRLEFINATAGRTIKVTLPAVTLPADPAVNFSSLRLLSLGLDDALAAARSATNQALDRSEEAIAATIPGSPDESLRPVAAALRAESLRADREIVRPLAAAANQPRATPGAPRSREELARVAAAVTGLATRGSNVATVAQGATAATTPPLDQTRAVIAVNSAASALQQVAATIEALALALAPSPAAPVAKPKEPKDAAEEVFGVRLDDCAAKAAGVECTPTLTLPPNSRKWVAGELLRQYPKNIAVKFSVTFFDEAEQPARPIGYFSLEQQINEAPSSATWTATGILQWAHDSFLGDDTVLLDEQYRFNGDRIRQFRGTARTSMLYQLGSRANGSIDLQFKSGIVGKAGEDYAVKANQYSFTVFGFRGSSLKFGKYTFANPTEGLAINESGEGGTVRYRWFGLSHIVKREGAKGAVDVDDNDHKVWIFDASSIGISGWTSLRSLSFFAVRGIDDTLGRERRYDTAGGEMLFGLAALDGTFAYYRSRSSPDAGSAATHASGNAWLARASHTRFENNKATRSASLTVAVGGGDQSSTSNHYEGYLGETAGFGADGSLYVSAIVPKLRLTTVPFEVVDKDGKKQPEFPQKGLVNRAFFSAAISDQTFSPLEWIAGAIGIPQKDVESRQSTLRLQHYGFTEPVLGTRAGSWELQAEAQLESPKGVKYVLKYSRVMARSVLEPLFPQEPHTFVAQCAISLK